MRKVKLLISDRFPPEGFFRISKINKPEALLYLLLSDEIYFLNSRCRKKARFLLDGIMLDGIKIDIINKRSPLIGEADIDSIIVIRGGEMYSLERVA